MPAMSFTFAPALPAGANRETLRRDRQLRLLRAYVSAVIMILALLCTVAIAAAAIVGIR